MVKKNAHFEIVNRFLGGKTSIQLGRHHHFCPVCLPPFLPTTNASTRTWSSIGWFSVFIPCFPEPLCYNSKKN